MKHITKNHLKKAIRNTFDYVEKSNVYKRLDKQNKIVKFFLGIFFILLGIVAWLIPPILGATIFLLVGLSIFIPLKKLKRWIIYLSNKFRINILYMYIYNVRYNIKSYFKGKK